jgi:hypothetical protein
MIRKSGYRFSEKIMLRQQKGGEGRRLKRKKGPAADATGRNTDLEGRADNA